MTMKDAIRVLLDHYAEYAINKSMDYTFGFFDALAVIRKLAEEEDKND